MFERSPAGFARVSVAGVAIVLGLLVLSPWFYAKEKGKNHEAILDNAEQLIEEGQQTFRFDTFGDEEFWGGDFSCTRRLREAHSAVSDRDSHLKELCNSV
jgi:hypothetical protein